MAGRIGFAKLGIREGGTYVVITGSVTPSPLLTGGKNQGGRTGVLWLAGWIGGTYATRTTTTTEKNFIDVRTKKTGRYQRDVRQVNTIARTRSYSRLGGTYGITTGQRGIGISDDVK